MKVKMKTIKELSQFARRLGGDMSEAIHYFIDMRTGNLIDKEISPKNAFHAKAIHCLEHGEEFLVVNHPNPISRDEYEKIKSLFKDK